MHLQTNNTSSEWTKSCNKKKKTKCEESNYIMLTGETKDPIDPIGYTESRE